jgi:hypothetical protein
VLWSLERGGVQANMSSLTYLDISSRSINSQAYTALSFARASQLTILHPYVHLQP